MMCTSVLVVFGVAGRARRGVESMTHNAANDVISGWIDWIGIGSSSVRSYPPYLHLL